MRKALRKPAKLLSPDHGGGIGHSDVSPPSGAQSESSAPEREHAKRYCVNPSLLLREIAGESILIPVGEATGAGNCIISLNETGSFLWKQYQTPCTLEDVVRAAREVYADSAGKMEQEICEYSAKLLQVGFLREVE